MMRHWCLSLSLPQALSQPCWSTSEAEEAAEGEGEVCLHLRCLALQTEVPAHAAE